MWCDFLIFFLNSNLCSSCCFRFQCIFVFVASQQVKCRIRVATPRVQSPGRDTALPPLWFGWREVLHSLAIANTNATRELFFFYSRNHTHTNTQARAYRTNTDTVVFYWSSVHVGQRVRTQSTTRVWRGLVRATAVDKTLPTYWSHKPLHLPMGSTYM